MRLCAARARAPMRPAKLLGILLVCTLVVIGASCANKSAIGVSDLKCWKRLGGSVAVVVGTMGVAWLLLWRTILSELPFLQELLGLRRNARKRPPNPYRPTAIRLDGDGKEQ